MNGRAWENKKNVAYEKDWIPGGISCHTSVKMGVNFSKYKLV